VASLLDAQYERAREARDRAAAQAVVDAELAADLAREEERRAQEARDAAAAVRLREEQLASVEAECVLCLTPYVIGDMFTLDCPDSHRFCMDCIKRQVGPARGGSEPASPLRVPPSVPSYARSSRGAGRYRTV
jgi:hypothetical protein